MRALGFRGDLAADEEGIRRWASRIPRASHRGDEAPRAVPSGAARDPSRERELRPLPGGRLLFVVSLLVAATAVVTLAGFIAAVHWRLDISFSMDSRRLRRS